jgi:hypothetical protein
MFYRCIRHRNQHSRWRADVFIGRALVPTQGPSESRKLPVTAAAKFTEVRRNSDGSIEFSFVDGDRSHIVASRANKGLDHGDVNDDGESSSNSSINVQYRDQTEAAVQRNDAGSRATETHSTTQMHHGIPHTLSTASSFTHTSEPDHHRAHTPFLTSRQEMISLDGSRPSTSLEAPGKESSAPSISGSTFLSDIPTPRKTYGILPPSDVDDVLLESSTSASATPQSGPLRPQRKLRSPLQSDFRKACDAGNLREALNVVDAANRVGYAPQFLRLEFAPFTLVKQM